MEQTVQGLKEAQAVVSEMADQRARVQIEPRGLEIHNHAQFCNLLHRLRTHETGVGDAWALLPHRPRLVEFFINIEQGVYCTIALRMRCELEPTFESCFHDGQEPFFRDEQHTSVLRIGYRIQLTDAPGFPHVGATRQHSAVEIGFDPDNLQPRIAFHQRICGHLANGVLHRPQIPDGFDVLRQ